MIPAKALDNIADVLGTSPALIERYIGAAAKISRLAVGDTDIGPISTTYKVRGDLSQDRHIEGLPVGTRGGILIHHNFPVDGEYLFKFSLLKVNFGPQYGGAAKDEQLEMSVNGERVLLRDLRVGPLLLHPGRRRRAGPPLRWRSAADQGGTADHHRDLHQEDCGRCGRSRSALRRDHRRPPDRRAVRIHDRAASVRRRNPRTRTTSLGRATRPAAQRIFRLPGPAASEPKSWLCARKIVATLARRAYRRPVTDADVAPLLTFYREGRKSGNFDQGIEMALRRILADPQFRVPLRTRSREYSGRAPRHRITRSGAGVALVVLPVEQHSRRRTPEVRRAGQAEGRRGAAAAGPPHAERSAIAGAGQQFRRTVAVSCAS